MKVEIEVRAFGELESLLTKLFGEVEHGYSNPKQCLGKITMRAKKANGDNVDLS
ncbi:hypothetical protein [Paenibacillus cellulositrophicus]|uniref:hypothetical protein n=1 Tax=Paenibacillus cellulositrophicus TaxID=562959 RepID=UPI00142EEFB6|nr:hypothetical protein [Paenibacillus cellulositrophicus]